MLLGPREQHPPLAHSRCLMKASLRTLEAITVYLFYVLTLLFCDFWDPFAPISEWP